MGQLGLIFLAYDDRGYKCRIVKTSSEQSKDFYATSNGIAKVRLLARGLSFSSESRSELRLDIKI